MGPRSKTPALAHLPSQNGPTMTARRALCLWELLLTSRIRHSSEQPQGSRRAGNPVRSYFQELGRGWVPAFAGTTRFLDVPLWELLLTSRIRHSSGQPQGLRRAGNPVQSYSQEFGRCSVPGPAQPLRLFAGTTGLTEAPLSWPSHCPEGWSFPMGQERPSPPC